MSAVEPTAPPQNARVLHVENDTLLIRWDPPSRQHRNGLLLGYRVSTTFAVYSSMILMVYSVELVQICIEIWTNVDYSPRRQYTSIPCDTVRDVKVSRPRWSRDHCFGLGLGFGLTVIGLDLGLGLIR